MRRTGERSKTVSRRAAAARALAACVVATALLGATGRAQTAGVVAGVVTYSDATDRFCYVQSGAVGYRVSLGEGLEAPPVGEAVRVDGGASDGNGPHSVVASALRRAGPEPPPAPIEMRTELASAGAQLGRLVNVSCVVHSAKLADGAVDLELATEEADFEAHVLAPGISAVPDRLVDARVRVRAVCGPKFKRGGQLTGYVLYAASLDDVAVVAPGPADPFAGPTREIASLLHGSPSDDDRRIHVRGVATLVRPGDAVFVEDETGGMYVSTDQDFAAAAGDAVDVLGYLTTVDSFASLYDAEIRSLGPGRTVVPLALTPAEVLAGSFDSRLVAIEGTVDGVGATPDDVRLSLTADGAPFTARLRDVEGADRFAKIGVGARVRVTGICAVRVGADKTPSAFVLYPRAAGDIVVLRAPPFWNADRLLWILAAGLALGAVVVAWVLVLRRRVRLQTAVIRRQVEAEAALDRRYRDLVERATDVIYTRTREGTIVSVNASGELVSGYGRDELIGARIADLVAPADARHVAEFAEDETFEVEVVRKDGERRVVEVREHALDGPDGDLLGVARDVTEQRRLSGQLQQAQRMECVGRLAGGVAHDFNNLLTVINGYGTIALDALETERVPRDELKAVLTAGERAASLTRHLLAFSRKQMLTLRPLDLNDVLSRTGPMLGRLIGEDVVVELRPGSDTGVVSADASQIEQVIMNLVVNARDAMPNGGVLTIETGSTVVDEAGAVRVADARPGAFSTVSVADTGTGIDPSIRERIFDPFFTTKSVGKGTGLGLSTVYGVVAQTGGWIEVESEVGVGTRFVVYLPRVADRLPSESGAAPGGGAVARGRETILVVEDEATVRTLAARILRSCGYHVIDAASGAEALDAFDAADRPIDLVLTDVIMPGMNGKELAEALRRRPRAPRVLFMSGYTDDVLGRHGVVEDDVDFVAKPFTPGELSRRVRGALDAIAV